MGKLGGAVMVILEYCVDVAPECKPMQRSRVLHQDWSKFKEFNSLIKAYIDSSRMLLVNRDDEQESHPF